MPGDIFDEFNAVLPEMKQAFNEPWTFGNTTYDAISIEKLTVGSKVMIGGQFVDADTEIHVDEDIFLSSGVKKGSFVTVRGQQLSVLRIGSDGDAARSLLCGPAQIDLWK